MIKLEVFDPPMCCSTGICGASAEQKLVIFASDLEWLKAQGVLVKRYGLSLHPAEFAKNEEVKNLINKEGNACLPVITVESKVVLKGSYPNREQLAKICGVEFNEDTAPPIHREENCCCGVDCDCASANISEEEGKFECSRAAAEENCFCSPELEDTTPPKENHLMRIAVILIILLIAVIIASMFCCKTGGFS